MSSDILPDADSSRSLGSASKKWKALHLSANTLFLGDSGSISAGAGGAISMPSLKIGSGAGAVELTASADGKLETKGTTAAGVTESAAKAAGSGVVLYDSIGAFPISGIDTGNMVMSKDKKGLYIWDSSEWDRIQLDDNVAPRFTIAPTTIAMSADTDSARITVSAKDEAGFPITYDWDGYGDSAGTTVVYNASNLPPQTTAITQPSDGVFRLIHDSASITPAGTFNLDQKHQMVH